LRLLWAAVLPVSVASVFAAIQGELGNVLGVSRQTINSIENERYMPSLPLALAIARYFDRSVEEIFTVDEEES
jgi:putative transcriptional regulator